MKLKNAKMKIDRTLAEMISTVITGYVVTIFNGHEFAYAHREKWEHAYDCFLVANEKYPGCVRVDMVKALRKQLEDARVYPFVASGYALRSVESLIESPAIVPFDCPAFQRA